MEGRETKRVLERDEDKTKLVQNFPTVVNSDIVQPGELVALQHH